MLSASSIARSCGLSRSTVLYYESIGLLKRPARTAANYRRYDDQASARLRQICVYRSAGLKLADIRALLDRAGTDASAILKRRMVEIDAEIEKLRSHQHAILKLLQKRGSFERDKMITKDKWVCIMKAAGLSEADMHRWHTQFEVSAPEEHQEFLEFLHIPKDEIRSIREWSRRQAAS